MNRVVPFKPEPVEAMRKRLPAALAETFDQEGVHLGTVEDPARVKRNVFDFPDGLRLVISKVMLTTGKLKLVVLASCCQPPHEVEARLLAISRDTFSGVRFQGMARSGAMHWFKDV